MLSTERRELEAKAAETPSCTTCEELRQLLAVECRASEIAVAQALQRQPSPSQQEQWCQPPTLQQKVPFADRSFEEMTKVTRDKKQVASEGVATSDAHQCQLAMETHEAQLLRRAVAAGADRLPAGSSKLQAKGRTLRDKPHEMRPVLECKSRRPEQGTTAVHGTTESSSLQLAEACGEAKSPTSSLAHHVPMSLRGQARSSSVCSSSDPVGKDLAEHQASSLLGEFKIARHNAERTHDSLSEQGPSCGSGPLPQGTQCCWEDASVPLCSSSAREMPEASLDTSLNGLVPLCDENSQLSAADSYADSVRRRLDFALALSAGGMYRARPTAV